MLLFADAMCLSHGPGCFYLCQANTHKLRCKVTVLIESVLPCRLFSFIFFFPEDLFSLP